MVKKVFETETLKIDAVQVEKYMSYQKYFPFALFAWEIFCFVLNVRYLCCAAGGLHNSRKQ